MAYLDDVQTGDDSRALYEVRGASGVTVSLRTTTPRIYSNGDYNAAVSSRIQGEFYGQPMTAEVAHRMAVRIRETFAS